MTKLALINIHLFIVWWAESSSLLPTFPFLYSNSSKSHFPPALRLPNSNTVLTSFLEIVHDILLIWLNYMRILLISHAKIFFLLKKYAREKLQLLFLCWFWMIDKLLVNCDCAESITIDEMLLMARLLLIYKIALMQRTLGRAQALLLEAKTFQIICYLTFFPSIFPRLHFSFPSLPFFVLLSPFTFATRAHTHFDLDVLWISL